MEVSLDLGEEASFGDPETVKRHCTCGVQWMWRDEITHWIDSKPLDLLHVKRIYFKLAKATIRTR